MIRSFAAVAGRLLPAGRPGWPRAGFGALCGIVLTALLCRMAFGDAASVPYLIAPMGASAVLLFAVPASPLAQPWSIVGGNTLSAVAGIACARLVPDPALAAGCAVALAIAVMSMARCLHPPGGAVAVTAVIGGPAVLAAGWGFALMPVAANSALLLAAGWLFNNATRHAYPHRVAAVSAPARGAGDAAPQDRIGYTRADLDAALARYDELLDVSGDDLDALFRQVQTQAYARLHGVVRCERIMSRDVIAFTPDMPLAEARARLAAGRLSIAPVVAEDGRVAGLLRRADLPPGGENAGGTVAAAMNLSPCLASADTPIDQLLPILSGGRHHEAIITDGEGRLIGLVTQTDLLAALWRGHVAEHVAAGGG